MEEAVEVEEEVELAELESPWIYFPLLTAFAYPMRRV